MIEEICGTERNYITCLETMDKVRLVRELARLMPLKVSGSYREVYDQNFQGGGGVVDGKGVAVKDI